MLWDISQNISQLFETAADSEDQMPVVRQLKENDLNDSFYSELEGYISALQSREDHFAMIALTQVIDEALKTLLLEIIRT